MKIALTVWEDRISPVFDAATTLMLVDIDNDGILKKRFTPLEPTGSMRLVEMLKQMNVSVLICGAISEGYASRLSFNGIKLFPFVSGKTEHVLETFARGEAIIPAFSMPGCGKQRCGRISKPSQIETSMEVTKMPGKNGTGPSGQGQNTGRGQGAGQGRGRCKAGPGAGKGKNPGRGHGPKDGSGQGRRQPK